MQGKQEPTESWYWPNLKVKGDKDKTIDSDEDDESDVPSKKSKVADNIDEEESSSSEEEYDDVSRCIFNFFFHLQFRNLITCYQLISISYTA